MPVPRRRKVLLVDDEPDIRSSLSALVESVMPGIKVVAAATPTEALEHLRTTAFQAVLSDYRMPEMHGLELLAQVRTLQPEAIRVLLTAYGQQAPAPGPGSEEAAQVFISKVLGPREFLAALGRLLPA